MSDFEDLDMAMRSDAETADNFPTAKKTVVAERGHLFGEEVGDETEQRQVDLTRATNRVWLVKLPTFLAEYWQNAPPGISLGSIKIDDTASGGGSNLPTVSLQVNQQLPIPAPKLSSTVSPPNEDQSSTTTSTSPTNQQPDKMIIPKDYNIKFVSNPPGNMLIFAENAEGEAVSIEGTVQHECNATPVLNDEYRNVMRARQKLAEVPKRSTQMLELRGDLQGISSISKRFMNADTVVQRQKKRKAEEFRKDRLPREEVAELILKAFQTHPHWSLKGIVEYTQQPATFAKEMLNELCDYIPRGPYKSMYQLKEEFKSK